MYRKFYGLEKKPFEQVPEGGLVHLSESHREGLAVLRYGLMSDKGFVLLTGGAGTGKTTLLNTFLGMIKGKVQVCLLNNPKLSRDEFFHYLGKKVNIPFAGNKGNFIHHFNYLLDRIEQKGGKFLLIIDEVQAFPIDLLEEIRLLSNHAKSRNVLSIFLVGQSEAQELLIHPKLLPLRQRIGIKYHLYPFIRDDTERYIHYRLEKAGAVNMDIFDVRAIDLIHEASQGNPRLINVICDHALVSGFARDSYQVNRMVIEECLNEIRLEKEDALLVSDPHYDQAPAFLSNVNNEKNGLSNTVMSILVTLALGATVWLVMLLIR